MPYVIAAPCIDHADQSCVAVCPVDCITADPAIDRKFYVDPDGCIECGQCEDACPNAAISRADRVPPAWLAFVEVDAIWFRDPDRARSMVDRLADQAA